MPGETITLIEEGGELPEELRFCSSQEELVRWAQTDDAGCYGLRLGPGQFCLRGPHPAAAEEVVVQDEAEVIRDFHIPHPSRGPLAGQVRRSGPEGPPIGNAIIRGEGVVLDHAGFEGVADQSGRFAVERWRERMLVYARDPEGAEAGGTEIGEEDASAVVVVSPAATARGRVVDREGGLQSGESVMCRMRVALADGTFVTFQIETRTDIEGAYTIPGLLLGSSCDVTVLRGYYPAVEWVEFAVGAAGPVELPDLILQERR
jgi:hypothetical protein